VDDVLVEGRTFEELLKSLENVLMKALEYSAKISEMTVKWGQEIKFGQFVIKSREHGPEVSPDPDLLTGIRDFPRLTNISELRGFISLANQITQWNPDLLVSLRRCRLLLKNGTMYEWTDEMEKEFVEAKKFLVKVQVLHMFNMNLPTKLLADRSRLFGLGFILLV
jgi:hypothetical protein